MFEITKAEMGGWLKPPAGFLATKFEAGAWIVPPLLGLVASKFEVGAWLWKPPHIVTMPGKGPKDQAFELERVDYLAPEGRGRIGGVSSGFPLWKMTMTIGAMSRDRSDQWRAFMANQHGEQGLFYAFEITRQMPRNYQGGFPGGFTGAASSWSQAVDSNGYAVLTLHGLYATLALKAGDYVDFRWGSYKRALVRLVEDATAVAGVLSVTIEPAVPNVVPASAVAHLDNTACLMRLLPQTQPGQIGRRGAIESGAIVAIQDLLP